jgi:hypothetical protein
MEGGVIRSSLSQQCSGHSTTMGGAARHPSCKKLPHEKELIGSVPGTTRKPCTSRLPPRAPEPVLLFPYSPIPLAVLGPCADVTTTTRIAGAIGSVCPRPRMRKNNWVTRTEQTSCDHTTNRPLYTKPCVRGLARGADEEIVGSCSGVFHVINIVI